MEIIGAGLPRTGTTSLKTALEQLGFGPCYHMSVLVREPARAAQWNSVAGGDADWDTIFSGYRSAIDFPAAAYWRELAKHYPEAKVILTLRDPDRWYDSMAGTVMRAKFNLAVWTVSRLVALTNSRYRAWQRWNDRLHDTAFEGRFTERARVLALFDRHVADVRAEIPADRLLVFEVAQGWAPLCAFLQVAVPDRPFPQVNDSAQFGRMWWRRMARLGFAPLLASIRPAGKERK